MSFTKELSKKVKKVQVVGLGTVGETTAYLFKRLGHEVFGYDIKPKDSPNCKVLNEPRAHVE